MATPGPFGWRLLCASIGGVHRHRASPTRCSRPWAFSTGVSRTTTSGKPRPSQKPGSESASETTPETTPMREATAETERLGLRLDPEPIRKSRTNLRKRAPCPLATAMRLLAAGVPEAEDRGSGPPRRLIVLGVGCGRDSVVRRSRPVVSLLLRWRAGRCALGALAGARSLRSSRSVRLHSSRSQAGPLSKPGSDGIR